jgi:hypothetical protein
MLPSAAFAGVSQRLLNSRAYSAKREAPGIETGPRFRPVARGGRIQATRLTDCSVADIVKRTPNGPDSIPSYLLATRCDQAS